MTLPFPPRSGKTTSAGSVPATASDIEVYRSTFIFNAFVFAQIFNEFNARSLGDSAMEAFRGVARSKIFLAVVVVSVVVQALVVEFGGKFTKCSGLTATHWAWTILLGAVSLPLGVVMRWIPAADRDGDYAEYYSNGECPTPNSLKSAESGHRA